MTDSSENLPAPEILAQEDIAENLESALELFSFSTGRLVLWEFGKSARPQLRKVPFEMALFLLPLSAAKRENTIDKPSVIL